MRTHWTSGLLAFSLLPASLGATDLPSEAGQSAFAALSEIVGLLSADEETDWRKVDILALREHLVDMDEVMLRARVEEQPQPNGVAVRVTGEGRTLEALQRMIPMHSHMVQGHRGWRVDVRSRADGFEIDLTAEDETEVARLRALGFFGFLAASDHHRRHHLGMATGAMSH